MSGLDPRPHLPPPYPPYPPPSATPTPPSSSSASASDGAVPPLPLPPPPPPPPPPPHGNAGPSSSPPLPPRDVRSPNDRTRPDAHADSEREARRRLRREERRRQKEAAAAEQLRELESDAHRLYFYGFFALPLLWLLSLFYFHREHRDENASPIIKNYYVKSRIMFAIYTVIFLTWFIVFQVKKGSLSALNILMIKAVSPSGI